ncbi:MAG: c-type cytochrome [Vulcanimicrobiaceae bacterium]
MRPIASCLEVAFVTAVLAGCGGHNGNAVPAASDAALAAKGQQVFRYNTFGDEQFWTNTLQMNTVIENGVSPQTALSVGLKVDVDALPASVQQGVQNGTIDLTSPATTVALLNLNAVVGVVGTVDSNNHLTSLGISCALCHSSVDNSFAKGIGHRLDGYPNRELNPGAIIALSPALTVQQKAVYNSWGAGRYDPRYNFDGINGPVTIPPAYGLADVSNVATYTGDGSIEYWNDYVAVTQMHGLGSFSEPRLGINVTNTVENVKPLLPALVAYEKTLRKPAPPPVTDSAAVSRGQAVFQSNCSSCHSGAAFSDANVTLHLPSETGMDPAYSNRSATKRYRTTPLRGLAYHPPYFHDGSAATLPDVVSHYVSVLKLNLTTQQQADLVAYLNTL